MGLLGRMTGWNQAQDAHNAILANYLAETASPEMKREIANRLVLIQQQARLGGVTDPQSILADLSTQSRIVQMSFIALACNSLGIPPSLRGQSFTNVDNPYLAEDQSSLDRIGVAQADLSRRSGKLLNWPGNNVKVDFLRWARFEQSRPTRAGFGRRDQSSAYEAYDSRSALDFDKATDLAHECLLFGVIERPEVRKSVEYFGSKFELPTNYDLAVATALAFFKSPNLMERLSLVQMMARVTAAEWFQEGNLSPSMLQIFEDELYQAYKP